MHAFIQTTDLVGGASSSEGGTKFPHTLTLTVSRGYYKTFSSLQESISPHTGFSSLEEA